MSDQPIQTQDGWSVAILRELFRNLQEFASFLEASGTSDLYWNGHWYNYWDVRRIYDFAQATLPRRQRQAIQSCLYDNLTEKQVAVSMGLSPTNPVAMYANKGLEKVLIQLRAGDIPGIRVDEVLEAA